MAGRPQGPGLRKVVPRRQIDSVEREVYPTATGSGLVYAHQGQSGASVLGTGPARHRRLVAIMLGGVSTGGWLDLPFGEEPFGEEGPPGEGGQHAPEISFYRTDAVPSRRGSSIMLVEHTDPDAIAARKAASGFWAGVTPASTTSTVPSIRFRSRVPCAPCPACDEPRTWSVGEIGCSRSSRPRATRLRLPSASARRSRNRPTRWCFLNRSLSTVVTTSRWTPRPSPRFSTSDVPDKSGREVSSAYVREASEDLNKLSGRALSPFAFLARLGYQIFSCEATNFRQRDGGRLRAPPHSGAL